MFDVNQSVVRLNKDIVRKVETDYFHLKLDDVAAVIENSIYQNLKEQL